MDLLGDYGSGSDESDGGTAAPAVVSVAAHEAGLPPWALQSDSGGLSTLPQSNVTTGSGGGVGGGHSSSKYRVSDFNAGFGVLPELGGSKSRTVAAAAAAGRGRTALGLSGRRKVVQLQTMKPLADSDDEDEQPKKRLKPSTRGLSFLESLPPPKHAEGGAPGSALGGGGGLGARSLGGGTSSQPPAAGTSRTAQQSSEPSVAAPGPQFSNDAFRVQAPADAAPAVIAAGAASHAAAAAVPPASPSGAMGGGTHSWADQHRQQQQWQHQPSQPAAVSPHHAAAAEYGAARPPADTGDAMLAAALAADTGRGGSGVGPADIFSGMGMEFKEVNQANLTYVDPTVKAAQTGTRQALGKDYEMQLRREADASEPTKLHKRKHQLQSLWHASKVKELEMLGNPGAQGFKTKRETQAKYGWSN